MHITNNHLHCSHAAVLGAVFKKHKLPEVQYRHSQTTLNSFTKKKGCDILNIINTKHFTELKV